MNSALQRARPTLRARLPERREEWRRARGPSGEELRVLERYIAAVQSLDATEIANVLRDDIVLTMPACAHYVRLPGTTVFRAQVLDVLRVEGDQVAEITAFEPHHFLRLGLPMVLPEKRPDGGLEVADE